MSKEFIIKNSRQQFHAATLELVETLSATFPDCEDTKDLLLVLKNVTNHSETQMDESLNDWFDHLNTKLNLKKARYGKALERLTGQAIVYHAMVYRDIDAIQTSMTSGMATRIGLFQKWNDERNTDVTKEIMWDLLKMMNEHCYKAKQLDLPLVPSRAEIQENIKSSRNKGTAQDSESSSMLVAFRDDINALCEMWKISPVLSQNDGMVRTWMERWSKFTAKDANQKAIRVHCIEKNGAVVLKALCESFPEFKLQEGTVLSEESWGIITRLNDVSTVVNSVPTGMMSQIEHMASKLAQDLQSGTINMSNVNLSQIGEQVLANCSESDMNDFAGSIEKLMPVVQSMATQPNMQSMATPPNT